LTPYGIEILDQMQKEFHEMQVMFTQLEREKE
jgi:hypothetical protein